MGERVSGLRVFLLGTLQLLSEGECVSCEFVDRNISNGIATVLFNKYRLTYERMGLSEIELNDINAYYEQWHGTTDEPDEKYACENDNGLQLIISLSLNEIP